MKTERMQNRVHYMSMQSNSNFFTQRKLLMKVKLLTPAESVINKILVIRNHKVILDKDLAPALQRRNPCIETSG